LSISKGSPLTGTITHPRSATGFVVVSLSVKKCREELRGIPFGGASGIRLSRSPRLRGPPVRIHSKFPTPFPGAALRTNEPVNHFSVELVATFSGRPLTLYCESQGCARAHECASAAGFKLPRAISTTRSVRLAALTAELSDSRFPHDSMQWRQLSSKSGRRAPFLGWSPSARVWPSHPRNPYTARSHVPATRFLKSREPSL